MNQTPDIVKTVHHLYIHYDQNPGSTPDHYTYTYTYSGWRTNFNTSFHIKAVILEILGSFGMPQSKSIAIDKCDDSLENRIVPYGGKFLEL